MQWIFASYLIRDFCFRFLKVVLSVMAKVRTMFSCLVTEGLVLTSTFKMGRRRGVGVGGGGGGVPVGGEEGKIVKKELTQFSGTQWL